MTLAIYVPRGRHHIMHRTNLRRRFLDWLRSLGANEYRHEGAVAVRPEEPIFDAEIVADPLTDANWLPEPGEDMPLIIGDWVAAEYHAEHKRPLELTRSKVPELDEWTGYWATIPVHTDEEQLALTAGGAE